MIRRIVISAIIVLAVTYCVAYVLIRSSGGIVFAVIGCSTETISVGEDIAAYRSNTYNEHYVNFLGRTLAYFWIVGEGSPVIHYRTSNGRNLAKRVGYVVAGDIHWIGADCGDPNSGDTIPN